MSGGSFRYACNKVMDEFSILQADLRDMAEWLEQRGKSDAAKVVSEFSQELDRILSHIFKLGPPMYDLLHAAEWWASCDWGEEDFDKIWQEYQANQKEGE